MKFDTKAVQGHRREFDPLTGAHRIPIYQTTTYVFKDTKHAERIFNGEEHGFIYSRRSNPTVEYLEEKVAFLEKGEAGLATASGMAAINTLFTRFLKTGDRIVASSPLYGGTYGLLQMMNERYGIKLTFIPANEFHVELEDALDDDVKLVYIETPANPTLDIVDIESTAKITRKYGIPLAVDNTFATPVGQRPIELGADYVIHSMTKYLSGHGDTIAGILVGPADVLKPMKNLELRFLGGVLSPFNAYLILRGIKTLGIRVRKHTENAMKVAEFLHDHPKIERVMYPGLPDHPLHEVARKQMNGVYSGVLSFIIKGGREAGRKLMETVQIPALAVSLGDTDSLIEHPASMTHATYSEEDLKKVGIHEGLIRLSVGLEDPDDLIEDLDRALSQI